MIPALKILFNLALTVAVEGAAICVRDKKALLSSVVCNLLTNPLLTLLLLAASGLLGLRGTGYWALTGALELGTVAAEAAVYRQLEGWPFRAALMVSAVLNLLSFSAGMLIRPLLQ